MTVTETTWPGVFVTAIVTDKCIITVKPRLVNSDFCRVWLTDYGLPFSKHLGPKPQGETLPRHRMPHYDVGGRVDYHVHVKK